jgi:hypothetical protein
MARSDLARKVLRELNNELRVASERSGTTLTWTAGEKTVLGLIADQADRKVALLVEYEDSGDPNVRARLSAEARLLEGSIARLLKQVQPVVPTPPTQTTLKAQRAAYARWDPERQRNASG